MEIKQFYDETLAHASYAVYCQGEIALVDPARDPQPYLDFARKSGGKIKVVIETHPHADFVSSHMEIAKITGAKILASKLLGADYPHDTFDDGDELKLGNCMLKALNTPGHSPDSISILTIDEKGKERAVFTGDTLFIGDVGRPDLRENAGNLKAKREELAREMYHSTRNILMQLEKDVMVYPAHGSGSLCGKSLSKDLYSTLEKQLEENYALQDMSEDEFVKVLLEDQPYIPKYFGFNVGVNKAGAEDFEKSVRNVPVLEKETPLEEGVLVIDTRARKLYNAGHVPGAINIIEDGKFETWLGSIVGPDEKFYLIAENSACIQSVIRRAAKIGYEKNIKGALLNPSRGTQIHPDLNLEGLKSYPQNFTIVDVRVESELKNNIYFENAINIPLHELRERSNEVPTDKQIVVHCEGGYRSATGSSILENVFPGTTVYDLSEGIKEFKKVNVNS
ncbi:MAG: MBL fold metallo-hydrolase [Cyclobacteriaceae bacterium]|nr:MBL fold metallo-hydrolase [Cyclobacteriaceae bacterium]